MIIRKIVTRCLSHPAWQRLFSAAEHLVDFLVLVRKETRFQNFIYCRNPLRMWFLVIGRKGKLF